MTVKSEIVCDFLRKYNSHPENSEADGQALVGYIKNYFNNSSWDVVISGGESTKTFNIGNREIPTTERILSTGLTGVLSAYGSKMRIGTMGLTKIGLLESERLMAEEEFRRLKTSEYKKRYGADASSKIENMSIPDRAYLIKGRNPILILHVIMPKFENIERDKPRDFVEDKDLFVGYGIGFPKSSTSEATYVQYFVNTVKQREYYEDEFEDDQVDDND